jgi:hypothetical protein
VIEEEKLDSNPFGKARRRRMGGEELGLRWACLGFSKHAAAVNVTSAPTPHVIRPFARVLLSWSSAMPPITAPWYSAREKIGKDAEVDSFLQDVG